MCDVHILVDEKTIATRIAEIGSEIAEFYKNQTLTVITVMNGGMFFSAALTRYLPPKIFIDAVTASSYINDQQTDNIKIGNTKLSISERHVLLVDDIIDSGKSLQKLGDIFARQNPLSIRYAVLATKPSIAKPHLQLKGWVCFGVPNIYLVGFGLDSKEMYRNLPYIGYLGEPIKDVTYSIEK